MENIGELIESFMKKIFPKIEEDIYNEFSLQHELGIYLRERLTSKGYKVQFERNISFFDSKCLDDKEYAKKYVKKEIDISIFDLQKNEKCAIELKFPTNGQHPKQLYKFCEDIYFMENVRKFAGFQQSYVLTLVNDEENGEGFYKGRGKNEKTRKIYNLFNNLDDNGCRCICIERGEIEYPINDNKGPELPISLSRRYEKVWETVSEYPQFHYYILPIGARDYARKDD